MGRLVKLIGIVVGTLLALAIAALAIVGLVLDPNDYKDDIAAAVARATGRQLTLSGDLELALFPSIRIAVGEAELANAPGFGEEPFARVESAELRLAIMPLLTGKIAVDEARLTGLTLNLARDANGLNNWQDLGGGGAPAGESADEPAAGGATSLDLDVAAIEVADARVTWSDAATGSRWELADFNLAASDFGPNTRFPLTMSFDLAGDDVAVEVEANTQATLALATNTYRLDELTVDVSGSGDAWPGGSGEANLAFDSLAADLTAETVELSGLTLDALGITMRGSLSGQRLFSDLTLSGAVDIAEFDPRDVLAVFDVTLDTADDTVLSRASAKANLLYSTTQLGLRDMQLLLDDSTLAGRVGLERGVLRYDLAVDDIDIDRYLPPAAEAEDAAAPEGSLDEVDLPLMALRELAAEGELRFGRAKFSGMTLTDARFALTAANGALTLSPSASLYGGTYGGAIRLDVTGDAATAAVEQVLQGVDLALLARDLLQSEDVSGTGDVSLNVTTAGSNVGQMRRDLDGDVAFTVADGALEGLDLWYELRRVRARIDQTPIPERPDGPRRTPFSSLSATGVVQDALLTNRDLTGVLDFMTITGQGTVNLLDDSIDFDTVARFVDGPTLQSDPAMTSLAGQELPLRVSGTLAEPSVLPDFAAVVRSRVGSEVRESVEEQKNELQERADEKRDELRQRLRGILNRD